MDNHIFKKLLEKYANGQELSPEEQALLREGYDHILNEEHSVVDNDPSLEPDEKRGIELRQKIDQRIAVRRTRRLQFRSLSRIAASLVLGFGLLWGAYWIWWNGTQDEQQLVQQIEILAGENKAKLTLADGSVISLDDAQNGTIATQGGVHIEKDADGNIRYRKGGNEEISTLAMNTIATPNGGQYRIVLPDGSVAMLNAASSLSYPVRFTEKERRVKMTGEIYFEIAKATDGNKKRIPFFVETDKQEVQVLGTHFNVNAYSNETAIRTTLVEGSVKVRSDNGQTALLKPGQQAVLAKELDVQQADIQQQLAWVNGDFVFRGETLESVVRQVERWYDVEVEYPPHIGKLRFNGMVSRSQPLSAIIKMIQSTKKAKVTIKERRLIVTD